MQQELYFRHLYSRTPGGPSLRARCESWDNYCDLFGVILHGARVRVCAGAVARQLGAAAHVRWLGCGCGHVGARVCRLLSTPPHT
jgi:hypothetical protein